LARELETNIGSIKGIGEKRVKLLNKLGIFTLFDLISYFPRSYEDRTTVRAIRETQPGEIVCVRAMAAHPVRSTRIRQGLELSKLRVVDDGGSMEITFFNQSYVKNAIRQGETYLFFGKMEGNLLRREMNNPVFEPEAKKGQVTGRIVPLYRATAGLSSAMIARTVEQVLQQYSDKIPDFLPDWIRREHTLAAARFSYENIHFPASDEALQLARRRLIFEELFLLSVGLALMKKRRGGKAGPAMKPVPMEPFYRTLPFSLTGAQLRAIEAASSDMCGKFPMNRLVQGDVGSGKTVVAAACVYLTTENGYQSALMAPTEILAEQHYKTLSGLLGGCGIRCALLTGSTGTKARRELLEALAEGEINLLVGTHALLTEGVEFSRLGLVVTDEQHRFGVNQRAALVAKGEHPHVMVMSATPIPRTLALIIYGDLEISVIDEMPPGRQSVDTFAVGEDKRERVYRFIRKLVREGRQVYIVCPAVEEGEGHEENADLTAATEYAARLQESIFPELKVNLLHGKMKPKEKEAVMAAFAAGEIDILVSTTVVEVGVDVPNAALMVVENAERFGLSQLHQLRGRVGRGIHKSYCVLISDHRGELSRERLQILCKTNDGFLISEEDLKLRGPGDFFGSRQHGLPALRIADLAGDMRVLQEAQQAAAKLLSEDGALSAPENGQLRDRVRVFFQAQGEIFN